jgi:hypothetical protein
MSDCLNAVGPDGVSSYLLGYWGIEAGFDESMNCSAAPRTELVERVKGGTLQPRPEIMDIALRCIETNVQYDLGLHNRSTDD